MLTDKLCPPQGLTPELFQKHFGTEQKCHKALIALRWPNGFVCPHCGSRRYSYCKPKQLFQCTVCRKQTSVRSGTFFYNSRTPLKKWFLAMYLIGASDNRIKNFDLAEFLEIKPDTASFMRRKYLSSRRLNSGNIGKDSGYMSVFPSPVVDTSDFLADKIAETLRFCG